jgi:hypothetical protein
VVESFWAIPDAANIRTPLTILREQAAALTEQTKGTLVGMVEAHQGAGDTLEVSLEVLVPALNDYRYRLLSYGQPVELYPGLLRTGNDGIRPVVDEANFVSMIKSVLSSEKVRNILTSLLSQVMTA